MSRKIAITGGAGFIGSNLAEALAEKNQVILIDDLSVGKMRNLNGIDAHLFKGSINDKEMLMKAFQDIDCVFHLAAIASVQKSLEEPLRVDQVNVDGTLNVLVAARDTGVKRLVFASSAAVYGDSPELPKRESMVPQPQSPYAVTKVAGEHYCQVFSDVYGLETVSLRFFNVFGPKQDPSSEYSGVVSRFISTVLDGRFPIIFGDGEQTRDFVFVKDAVRACILASQSKQTGVYNVAHGQSTSLNRLVEMIENAIGRKIQPIHTEPRAGDIRHSLADIAMVRSIGYDPHFSVEEGLERTIAWMRANSIN
jgi:UDP-glucose 4-epimerase